MIESIQGAELIGRCNNIAPVASGYPTQVDRDFFFSSEIGDRSISNSGNSFVFSKLAPAAFSSWISVTPFSGRRVHSTGIVSVANRTSVEQPDSRVTDDWKNAIDRILKQAKFEFASAIEELDSDSIKRTAQGCVDTCFMIIETISPQLILVNRLVTGAFVGGEGDAEFTAKSKTTGRRVGFHVSPESSKVKVVCLSPDGRDHVEEIDARDHGSARQWTRWLASMPRDL